MYFNKLLHKKIILISLVFLPYLSNSQNIPYIGNSSTKLWGKTEESNIGRESYNILLSEGRVITDLDNQDYLNYLGNKISTYTNTRVGLKFFLTNANSINAFAGIGGYIGINAGLVLETDNEHELAGVLAHEISHVSQEHIARTVLAINDRQIANIAAMTVSILIAAKSNGDAGIGLASGVIANETQQQLNDIRFHEIEADRIGRSIMQKAGYSEVGMYSFFAKLFTPSYAKKVPPYLLTHPLPQDRQADIGNLGESNKKLKSSDEFYLFRARLRVKLLPKKELQQVINKDLKSEKKQIKNIALYTQSLQYLKYGKIKLAKSSLVKLTNRFSNKRDVMLLKAKLERLDGNNKIAKSVYKKLWKKYSNDNVVGYDYASFLKSTKSYKLAANVLDKLVEQGTTHFKIYNLYGTVLNKLGKHTKKQEILIYYYQLSGNYEKAKTQVKIALKNLNIDWKTRTKLESKQVEIERLVQSIK